MKKTFLFLCLFLIIAAIIPAQEWLREIQDTDVLTYEQAALLILDSAGVWHASGNNITPSRLAAMKEESFLIADYKGWLPKGAQPGGNIRHDEAALLLMHAFDLKGGFLYSLFKTPNFAYRELVNQNVIQGRSEAQKLVSGMELNDYISRIHTLFPKDMALLQQVIEELEAKAGIDDVSVRITGEGAARGVTINIQFVGNTAAFSQEQELVGITEVLRVIPQRNILVTGHTADVDNDINDIELSRSRAQAVADRLLGARTSAEITVQGLGSGQPIADNDNPTGRKLNRRVEITILENQ